MAPEGEFLAYINPKEAQMLKAGGSGIMTPMGIPSFVDMVAGHGWKKVLLKSLREASFGGPSGPSGGGGGIRSNTRSNSKQH